MVEHSASVIVKAPVHQVYTLFTHFNDFPKFMSFVQEVTYYDDQRSHWVVNVFRQYAWDAVNEDWIADQQIGWRSIQGLNNSGRVKFRTLGPTRTSVDVYIRYIPPTGPFGELGATLGISSYFENALQKDLTHFAHMVEQAPPGALDPMSSHYLFHNDSATVKGLITPRQEAAMKSDPMMSTQALAERRERITRELEAARQAEATLEAARKRQAEAESLAAQQRTTYLKLEASRKKQELRKRAALKPASAPEKVALDLNPRDPNHPSAAFARTLGDKDGGRARFPNYAQDPMTSRRPTRTPISEPPRSQ